MSLWQHELRLLWRDSAARVVLPLWCLALLYALATGWQVMAAAQAEADAFVLAAQQRTAAQLSRVERAGPQPAGDDRYAGFPSLIRAPAVLPTSPLSFLTLGEMDLRPHTATVSLFSTEQGFAKGHGLQSPATLASGRFDLAFAVIVLLPLALVALCYPQLADDRERQRLPLLAAQGSVRDVLLRRIAVRGAVVLLPLLLVTAAAALAAAGAAGLAGWALWIAPAVAYALCWLAVCAAVGRRALSSGAAATGLVCAWLVVVLVLPAALAALAQWLLPPPSAPAAVVSARAAQVEADRERERILGRYVSDHPELKASTEADDLAWTRGYYAQLQFVERALAPLREQAGHDLRRHRGLHDRLSWLSPAQVLERALSGAAGTDASRYEAFTQQLRAFKRSWDAPLLAPLFRGQSLKPADFGQFPAFSFSAPPRRAGVAESAYLAVLALLAWLAVLSRGWRGRRVGDPGIDPHRS